MYEIYEAAFGVSRLQELGIPESYTKSLRRVIK
jgi:hypothetical protein